MFRSLKSEAFIRISKRVKPTMLAAVFASVCVVMMAVAAAMTPARHTAFLPQDLCTKKSGCFVFPQRDISFLIDASGSIANRGEAYNAVIEGLIRAVQDPTIIPRDGSVAVSVVQF